MALATNQHISGSQSESEGKKIQEKLFYSEQELAASRGREHSLQNQLLKVVNDNQEWVKKHMQSYNELEVKFQNELKLKKNAESLATASDNKAAALEKKLQSKTETSDRGNKHLRDELVLIKEESNFFVSKMRADMEKMERRAKNAENESELLKRQLQNMKSQLNECLHQKSEMEKNNLSNMKPVMSSSTGTDILVKNLQDELKQYESEVREAKRIKFSHENIELLKEKLLQERLCRERAEKEALKLPEIELNAKKLADELLSWKLMFKDIPDVSSPEDVPLKLASLQKQLIESTVKVGEVNARLKGAEVALDTSEMNRKNADIMVVLAKERESSYKSDIKKMEAMISLFTEERDGLEGPQKFISKSSNEEISVMESSHRKKESFIAELNRCLCEQKDINKCQSIEIELLNEKLNNETKKVKSLDREGDRLRSEISILESKLGHGDFSTANTKVLRMVNTLTVDNETKQTIELLKNELHRTKEKLKIVEELKQQSADSGKLVDSYISGRIVQLKEQIAKLEKREERYKSVFADRISVFRRACCELFGYKIVMDDQHRPDGIPVTRFTLISIYAQGDDEKLEFNYESGNVNILENSYALQPEIAQQVEVFIRKMNSIPAFTANLTVESFNRRTLS